MTQYISLRFCYVERRLIFGLQKQEGLLTLQVTLCSFLVIYVRGSHGFFCSGADLSVLKNHFGEKDGVDMCYFMQATLDKLRQLDIISVALVEGMAIGGGTEVALSCDFRVFEAGAGFRMVQAHRGLSPGWGAGAKLLKLVGRRRAIELLCGARELRGDELLEYGVADCIADAGPIEDAADRFCAAFLHEGYTDAVKQCKSVCQMHCWRLEGLCLLESCRQTVNCSCRRASK